MDPRRVWGHIQLLGIRLPIHMVFNRDGKGEIAISQHVNTRWEYEVFHLPIRECPPAARFWRFSRICGGRVRVFGASLGFATPFA